MRLAVIIWTMYNTQAIINTETKKTDWHWTVKIDPEHSRPLDVHRWSDHPEIKALTDEIWLEITEVEGLIVLPTGNRKPLAPLIKQLRVLLVDLYVGWLADPSLSIGISRSNNSYVPKSRYNGFHISKDILKVVDALVAIGLLDHSANKRDIMYVPHLYGVVDLSPRDIETVNWLYSLPVGFNYKSIGQDKYQLEEPFRLNDVLLAMQGKTDAKRVPNKFEKNLKPRKENPEALMSQHDILSQMGKFNLMTQNIQIDPDVKGLYKGKKKHPPSED